MQIDALEPRRLLSGITIDEDTATVFIAGDGAADAIVVRQVGTGIELTLNNSSLVVPSRAPAPEWNIDIQSLGGDDSITIRAMNTLQINMLVDAGGGRDALTVFGHEAGDDIESFVESIVVGAIGSHTIVGYANAELFTIDALGGDDFMSPDLQPGVEQLTINAGDGNDIVQTGQSTPLLGRSIQIFSGAGDDRVTFGANPPGGVQYLLRDGTIDATGVGRVSYDAAATERVTLFGGFSGDTIAVATSASIEYTVIGGDGTTPGTADRLRVLNAGATSAQIATNPFGGGTYTFADRKPIVFAGIEQRDAIDSTPPTLVKFKFVGVGASEVIAQFSEDVSAQLDASAVQLIDLATGQPIPRGKVRMTIVSVPGSPTTARWRIVRSAPAHVRATVMPSMITDASLNAVDSDGNGTAGGPSVSIESRNTLAEPIRKSYSFLRSSSRDLLAIEDVLLRN